MRKKLPRTKQILETVSALVVMLRSSLEDLTERSVLEEVEQQLQQFADSWLDSGDDWDLPNGCPATLSDVDVTSCILEAVRMRLEQFHGIRE